MPKKATRLQLQNVCTLRRPKLQKAVCGPATSATSDDFMPLWLEVRSELYESLGTVEVEVDDEVA